jgi:hypothetical protein
MVIKINWKYFEGNENEKEPMKFYGIKQNLRDLREMYITEYVY